MRHPVVHTALEAAPSHSSLRDLLALAEKVLLFAERPEEGNVTKKEVEDAVVKQCRLYTPRGTERPKKSAESPFKSLQIPSFRAMLRL